MIKQLICMILILYIFCGCMCNCKDTNPRPEYVKIVVDSNEGSWSGSGVFVADDIILTAGHVVRDANIITIIYPDKSEVESSIWFMQDPNIADLGIIIVDTNDIEADAIFADVEVEQDIILCGAPLGIFPLVTKGIVSGKNIKLSTTMFGNCPVIIIDAATNGGNSGGPVFDDKNRLIGILVGVHHWSQGMNIVIPIKECQEFLDEIVNYQ